MIQTVTVDMTMCSWQGLGAQSVTMYDFLIPMIQMSTDVSQDLHVYLCEDALDLWHTTLQQCPRITPGLLDLYANVQPLLGGSNWLYLTYFLMVTKYCCKFIFLSLNYDI